MSGEEKHDDLLLNVLKEDGQILPFLDTVFGFLYRRTDLFIEKDNQDGRIGFLPGVAELAVRDTFRKWQKMAAEKRTSNQDSFMENDVVSLVTREEEVMTTDTEETEKDITVQKQTDKRRPYEDLSSEMYNGADCGTYRWCQTLLEVDIKVPVPSHVARAGDVRVEVGASRLTVGVRDSQGLLSTLVDGDLSFKHLRDESIWTLTPGKHITIHLQKVGEQWWNRLLSTENKLDMSTFDVSRHVKDLPEDDKMQVEKVLVQEERKHMGILPPEHQEKIEMLKKAWNAEGSPFQGQPFDPSVLQLPQK